MFHIPKKVIPVEEEMIEERVRQGLFKPVWGPFRNAHFLVPKKNAMYRFIISAVSTNRLTLEDSGIPPNIEEFSETFAGLPVCSLIAFHSGFHQKILHEDSRDNITFQTTQGMYRPTTLVQEATNSVSALFRVCRKILNPHLGSISELLVDGVGGKGPKSQYGKEEVEGLPGVRWFVMETLQNLNHVSADVDRPGAAICGEKSDR